MQVFSRGPEHPDHSLKGPGRSVVLMQKDLARVDHNFPIPVSALAGRISN